MIQTKCRFCGKEALLDEADKRVGKVYYERVFVCPDQHKTILRDGKPAGDPAPSKGEENLSPLEKLNKFLDELEGKRDA